MCQGWVIGLHKVNKDKSYRVCRGKCRSAGSLLKLHWRSWVCTSVVLEGDFIWIIYEHPILTISSNSMQMNEDALLFIYLFIYFCFLCVCVSVCALSHIYAGTHPHVYKGQRSTLVVYFYSFLPFGLFLTHWLWSSLIGWLDWLTTCVSQGCCCLYLPRAGIIGTHHHGC